MDSPSPEISRLHDAFRALRDGLSAEIVGQSALVETTIDGALITPLQLLHLPGPAVARVVADPVIHPSDPPEGQRGVMMLEANGHSYNVYSGSVVDLATDPAFASPSTAPGKEPPPATAPFFLD